MKKLFTTIGAVVCLSACQPAVSTSEVTENAQKSVATAAKKSISETERLNEWFCSEV